MTGVYFTPVAAKIKVGFTLLQQSRLIPMSPAQTESLHAEKQIHLKRNIQWFHTWSLHTETWFSRRLRPFNEQVKLTVDGCKNQKPNQTKNRLVYCKGKKNVIKQLYPSIPTRQQPGPVWPAHYPHCQIHEGADWGHGLTPLPHHSAQVNHLSASLISNDTRFHVEQAQPCQAHSKHSINLH